MGPLALFVVINIFGGISGGHFNPAVTLGVYCREARWAGNFFFLIMIIASQICGALCGALLSVVAMRYPQNGEYKILKNQVAGTLLLPTEVKGQLADGASEIDLSENLTTLYMQVICTFIFVFFILHVTGRHTVGPDLGVWGVPAICIVLWALCSVDNFTGASFNPALAIGNTMF